jgi:hypothetical protein
LPVPWAVVLAYVTFLASFAELGNGAEAKTTA